MSDFIFESNNGGVRAWLEQGAVHLKAVDEYGDPVELSFEEAIELAGVLRRYAEICEQGNSNQSNTDEN